MVNLRKEKRRLGRLKEDTSQLNSSIKRVSQDNNLDNMSIDKFYRGLILNADHEITIARLYIVIAGITISVIFALTFFAPIIPFIITVIIAMIVGFGLPTIILKKQVKARHYKFAEQFPDAIELIVRSLRVGQPLSIAMQTVGQEMSDPIGKEFDLVSQEITYGKDVPDALESMLGRITLQDLRFFIVAVQIQHESGGNLAEVLEGLSKIIRGRFRLMRKVKALTAEGRFSAWFLSAFPVFMLFVMNVINPGYYTKVSDYEYFPHIAALMAVMLIINVIAMRIMTTIRV